MTKNDALVKCNTFEMISYHQYLANSIMLSIIYISKFVSLRIQNILTYSLYIYTAFRKLLIKNSINKNYMKITNRSLKYILRV